MKIEKFLKWITERLLNYPDISFITVKLFIQEFYKCLSTKEQNRYKIECQMINTFTLRQISIDTIVNRIKTNNLKTKLNNLKNDKNVKTE